jgi:hypothetical protein
MRDTKTATAPATDPGFLIITKICRIPRAAVKAIEPARDGSGNALVVTDRGCNRARETYDEVMAQFAGRGKGARNE